MIGQWSLIEGRLSFPRELSPTSDTSAESALPSQGSPRQGPPATAGLPSQGSPRQGSPATAGLPSQCSPRQGSPATAGLPSQGSPRQGSPATAGLPRQDSLRHKARLPRRWHEVSICGQFMLPGRRIEHKSRTVKRPMSGVINAIQALHTSLILL